MGIIPSGDMLGEGARKEVRLLVVDEQGEHYEHIQTFADMYIPQAVIECKLAEGAEEAGRVMDSWSPSVVLLDIHLMSDALGLIGELTQKGAAVVALSEVRIPTLVQTAQAYGAVGYFAKSNNPDDIEALMAYVTSIATSSVVSH